MSIVKQAPIVLIHGIRGSHLAQTYDDSFDVIWSAAQHRFESIFDLELDSRGDVEADPWDVISVMKIEQAAYGELLARLRKRFDDTPVYIFRYDWRIELTQVAAQLGMFFDRLERKTGKKAFRVVTHSMGSLVLAAFLNLDPANNLRRIKAAVMAAPPLHGAVEAVRTLIVGDAVRFGVNSSEAYRKIARSFPSAYELVPGYDKAWNHPHPGASIWDLDFWQHRVRFDGRDRNVYKRRDAVMQSHLTRAERFHSTDILDFDALPRTQRNKFMVIYGTDDTTRVKIRVKERNKKKDVRYFFDFDAKTNFGDGDGTVPVVSARRFKKLTAIPVSLKGFSPWWPSMWDDKLKIRIGGFHAMFLGLDKVQGLVCDWFEGKKPKASWAETIVP